MTALTTPRATKATQVSTRRIFCEYIARVAGRAIVHVQGGDVYVGLYTIWRFNKSQGRSDQENEYKAKVSNENEEEIINSKRV